MSQETPARLTRGQLSERPIHPGVKQQSLTKPSMECYVYCIDRVNICFVLSPAISPHSANVISFHAFAPSRPPIPIGTWKREQLH
jgi:hypothetical protein